jgi:hypothetical protein
MLDDVLTDDLVKTPCVEWPRVDVEVMHNIGVGGRRDVNPYGSGILTGAATDVEDEAGTRRMQAVVVWRANQCHAKIGLLALSRGWILDALPSISFIPQAYWPV